MTGKEYQPFTSVKIRVIRGFKIWYYRLSNVQFDFAEKYVDSSRPFMKWKIFHSALLRLDLSLFTIKELSNFPFFNVPEKIIYYRSICMSITKVYLVASGDLRLSANQLCWPEQAKMEAALTAALTKMGVEVVRAHAYDEKEKHGFISSQKMGLEVFSKMDPDIPVIVAESVWEYTHHVLPGLLGRHAPILTIANWSGTWPGLVGMLNINASLWKAGKPFSSLWSVDFTDEWFLTHLKTWIETGKIEHKLDHVHPYESVSKITAADKELGRKLADELRQKKAIMGIFDEGCMGMYNAIIPDELLFPLGIFKERLSQSALYYETTQQVSDAEAEEVFQWMVNKGTRFHFGTDEKTELTKAQVLLQCKMYIAAVRIADRFGCTMIGIQYQQGLKDLLPASDLVEGMLNNADRPPVKSCCGNRILFEGQPVLHFNEVDECAAMDALLDNRVLSALGEPVETTLHDVRWGDWDASKTTDEYVWAFQISGAAPPAHFDGGWAGVDSMRQSPMYFPFGGGAMKGIYKPGELVWSRTFVENGQLNIDIGRAKAISLPKEETDRRFSLCADNWPLVNAVFPNISRDQFMARHHANHIQTAYASSAEKADRVVAVKAAMACALGFKVNICGDY